jgi:K+/H+ antiporter YhaU regulatory subunit KhtT
VSGRCPGKRTQVYGVVILVVVALMSLLVTRVATVALTATGMARTSARFQARSALSGVGFTTSEAEGVVNHPARRRIIMGLMLAGNVGLVTAVAGLLGGFLDTPDAGRGTLRALLLVGGLGVVYVLSKSDRVDRALSSVIGRWLQRYTDLDVRDYAALLHVSGDYAVKELKARPGSWLTAKPIGELKLRDEGVLVLGIIRADGTYEGAPRRATCIEAGDTAILYGRTGTVADIAQRRTGTPGDADHERHRID